MNKLKIIKVGKNKKYLCYALFGWFRFNILNIAFNCYNLLTPQHIGHGFMRCNVINVINVHLCNAQTYFSNGTTIINNKSTNKLCNTIKPEHKRKIIDGLFVKLCD